MEIPTVVTEKVATLLNSNLFYQHINMGLKVRADIVRVSSAWQEATALQAECVQLTLQEVCSVGKGLCAPAHNSRLTLLFIGPDLSKCLNWFY